MQLMKKLKIILQSSAFYWFLFLGMVFYLILMTKVIKYETKITDYTNIVGVITSVAYEENKISI